MLQKQFLAQCFCILLVVRCSGVKAWAQPDFFRRITHKAALKLDVEAPPSFINRKIQIPLRLFQRADAIRAAERSHGMPWKTSKSPDCTSLRYMPFYEWQIKFMKKRLTNLRPVPTVSRTGGDMSYAETKTHRIHTVCFESDEYKLIRLTSLDAGHQTQVFTSLWYPRDRLLPVLGTDLLKFNQRHLCIVDFQPIAGDESDHDNAYEHLIAPIRSQYKSLQGTMTDRFYSADDPYFSSNMLLGRYNATTTEYTADEMVYKELLPAFQEYVRTHVDLVQRTAPTAAVAAKEHHRQYDTYSASRDPAHHLLAKIFGQEWADEYVYDILFPLAQRQIMK